MSVKAYCSFTVPGLHAKKTVAWDTLGILLRKYFKEVREVDTLPSYYNLNQDFYEILDEVETSWGTVRPKSIADDDWQDIQDMLNHGAIIMLVWYVDENGKYVPHH